MLPIFMRVAAAVRKLMPRSASTAPSRLAKVKPTAPPRPYRKPNKVIYSKPARPEAPVSTGRIPVGSAVRPQPRLTVPPSPQGMPDRTHADTYHRSSGSVGGSLPTPTTDQRGIGQQGGDWTATAANLAFAASSAQQLASSFVPGVTWTGTVEARGFKSTPLRDVLHYCLAVIFGTVHQTRIGSTTIDVHTFPVENRVQVIFSSSTSLLLEPINVAAVKISGLVRDAGVVPGGRPLAKDIPVEAGIRIFGPVGEAALAMAEYLKFTGEQSRLLGAGGIWDMAQSNIYAGRPPASMIVSKVAPFTDMEQWALEDKRPMLTRDLSFNPEIPEIPGMHWPTHFDLRSLVSQALYDPGVLPPVPDTVVALEQQDLS